jgi:hypothetical protein
MTSSAYVNPVLVLDASDADATGAYTVYAIARGERAVRARRVGDDAAVAEPTGSIPVTDVELGQRTGFRVRTLGIERHASH